MSKIIHKEFNEGIIIYGAGQTGIKFYRLLE